MRVVLPVVQRRRLWTNVKPTLIQLLVSAELTLESWIQQRVHMVHEHILFIIEDLLSTYVRYSATLIFHFMNNFNSIRYGQPNRVFLTFSRFNFVYNTISQP